MTLFLTISLQLSWVPLSTSWQRTLAVNNQILLWMFLWIPVQQKPDITLPWNVSKMHSWWWYLMMLHQQMLIVDRENSKFFFLQDVICYILPVLLSFLSLYKAFSYPLYKACFLSFNDHLDSSFFLLFIIRWEMVPFKFCDMIHFYEFNLNSLVITTRIHTASVRSHHCR